MFVKRGPNAVKTANRRKRNTRQRCPRNPVHRPDYDRGYTLSCLKSRTTKRIFFNNLGNFVDPAMRNSKEDRFVTVRGLFVRISSRDRYQSYANQDTGIVINKSFSLLPAIGNYWRVWGFATIHPSRRWPLLWTAWIFMICRTLWEFQIRDVYTQVRTKDLYVM